MEAQCQNCQTKISWKMADVSVNRFRKMLCIRCQEIEIDRTYPPKLADFAKKQLAKFKN